MRVKQELADLDIVVEEWGGKVMCMKLAQKTISVLADLPDSILLLSEVEEFTAHEKTQWTYTF